jgi:DHA2 family multidrug resistance protein
MGLIVVGAGLLQFVLDKGEQNDWLSSNLISVCLAISVVALVVLVINEFLHEDPIMDLRLLRNRDFATAVSFSFILGMVLNGSTILLPLLPWSCCSLHCPSSCVAPAQKRPLPLRRRIERET